MKPINAKLIFFAMALAGLALLQSCKKDFLAINNNPNSPSRVDVKLILPSAQSYIGYTMGNHLALAGGFWSQFWTQGPNANQYAALDQYIYNAADADYPWSAMYAGALKDLEIIYQTSLVDTTKKNYGAIARILQAYTYQVITDAWGEAPFSQSLKGDSGIVEPTYDSEQNIYDGILGMVNEGMMLLDDAALHPGTDDLIYNGDLLLWYKFANTLKLKILLRQTGVREPLAQQNISEMFTNAEPFLDEGEDAKLIYADQKFQQSPLYTTGFALGTSSNIFGSATIIGYLNALGDPRVQDYFQTNAAGNYNGLIQGEGKLLGGNQSDGTWSKPSKQTMGATAPTTLISAAESYFLQAEAIARGYAPGNGKSEYEAGIQASWSSWINSSALVATDINNYLAQDSVKYPNSGSKDDRLRAIITQKWVAMAGNQNFEAWTEWRRTGYPEFLVPSATSVLGGNKFPARLIYPSDEVTTNTKFPGIKQVDVKVWWDTN